MRRSVRIAKLLFLTLLGGCAGLVFNTPPARADGLIRDGLGAISTGRGGTNIAHADNGEILLDNPASMVNIAGHQLTELSFDVLFTDLHYSDQDPNDTNAEYKPLPMAQWSSITKSCDDQWAFGLGVFAPAGFSAEYDLNGPPALAPGVYRYKSLGALIKILPGVAYRLTDGLAVGGTFGLAVGHTELEGPFFLQTGGPLPAVLDLQATGTAITWSIGLQYELSERTTVGLTYQSETRFELDGNARVNLFGLQSMFDAEVDVVWPRSLGVGLKHDLCEHRSIAFDVIWFNWSDSFDSFDLRLSDGSNVFLPPAVSDRLPLNWRDSVSLRAGYECLVTPCSVLRFGYAYHANQIPEETLTPYIQAILEHAFSIGYGTCWDDWNVDLAYQFSFGPDRSVETSSILGGDFDFAQHKAQAHWVSLSFSKKY